MLKVHLWYVHQRTMVHISKGHVTSPTLTIPASCPPTKPREQPDEPPCTKARNSAALLFCSHQFLLNRQWLCHLRLSREREEGWFISCHQVVPKKKATAMWQQTICCSQRESKAQSGSPTSVQPDVAQLTWDLMLWRGTRAFRSTRASLSFFPLWGQSLKSSPRLWTCFQNRSVVRSYQLVFLTC